MYYKNDWEQAKERVLAFWENEIIDRCCVGVYAPRKTSKLGSFPELQYGPWLGGLDKFDEKDTESIRQWWTDPEENHNRMITWFENTYFGGEVVPATYINWGGEPLAAFYGSEPVFSRESVWYPPVIRDWNAWEWRFDPNENRWWQQIRDILAYLIEQNEEEYGIGMPEIGRACDTLALMRGSETLAMDLITHPADVNNAIDILTETGIEIREQVHDMVFDMNGGGDILAWMGLWAPGRHDQIACDFSSLISPGHFREYVLPEINRMGEWCDYATYHLDGPDALQAHLNTLLGVEKIDTIQWTPGYGNPPTYYQDYIPKYQAIQSAGKRLYLLAKPEEVEGILSELSPKGLFINTYANSEEDARLLMDKIAKWSVLH